MVQFHSSPRQADTPGNMKDLHLEVAMESDRRLVESLVDGSGLKYPNGAGCS